MVESNVKGLENYERRHDILLITGDGTTLMDDYGRFLKFGCDYERMCLGRSPQITGSADHYAALDWDQNWYASKLIDRETVKYTHFAVYKDEVTPPGFNVIWDAEDVEMKGAGGLFAVSIGLLMGFKKIVLAGCPLDNNGHWYNIEGDPIAEWTQETQQEWSKFAENKNSVKSLSGNTAEYFGMPDKTWIATKRTETQEGAR